MGKIVGCIKLNNNRKCKFGKLRNLTEALIQKIVEKGLREEGVLNTSMSICNSCRVGLQRDIANESVEELPTDDDLSSEEEEVIQRVNLEVLSQESLASMRSAESVPGEFSQSVNIEIFNRAIPALLTSPIDPKRVVNPRYLKEKSDDICKKIKKNIFRLDPEEISVDEKVKAFDEMIDQLKQKYASNGTTRQEKLQLLTVLPRSWTVQKMMDTFNTTRYLATQAKELLDEGAFHTAQRSPRLSTGLSDQIKDAVVEFYENDDVSRAMPGKRDCLSVRKDGKRQSVQIRLMTSTLRESYNHLKEEINEIDIGFSTFAKLRPKNCKLLSSTGTHNVCVCTIHENVNLMLHSLKKYHISVSLDSLTNSLICKDKTTACYLRYCEHCSDSFSCEQFLSNEIEEKCIDELHFEQWVTTDRCDIITIVKKKDEFISYLMNKLEKLIPHDFVKKEQSKFLKNCKNNLKSGEFVITCDFSENYTFVLQDEVQSHHWNAQQATIHPFVIYYKKGNQIEHLSFVVISEDLRHDSISVNLFISKVINFLRVDKQFEVNKIYFMSDGAASQYKNRKNFSSLCQFKNKYNIEAEWHFFATSHGKGPCDAIGGTLKRMATRASLAKEREHPIKDAKELYEWACLRKEDQLTKINFCYTTSEDYKVAAQELEKQYSVAKTIPGTQKYHSFIPISENQIEVRLYSNSNQSHRRTVID